MLKQSPSLICIAHLVRVWRSAEDSAWLSEWSKWGIWRLGRTLLRNLPAGRQGWCWFDGPDKRGGGRQGIDHHLAIRRLKGYLQADGRWRTTSSIHGGMRYCHCLITEGSSRSLCTINVFLATNHNYTLISCISRFSQLLFHTLIVHFIGVVFLSPGIKDCFPIVIVFFGTRIKAD